MHHKDTLFSQIIKHIPRYKFDSIVEQYGGDRRVRKLSCWTQFMSLLYGQFTGRKSLRDIESNLNAQQNHLYHLGCRGVKRSTLAAANMKRPAALYEALFTMLLGKVQAAVGKEAQTVVKLLDSTVISLTDTRFGWALGHHQFGIKIHTVYDLDAAVPTYFAIDTARSSDLSHAKLLQLSPGETYVFDRGYYDFNWWNEFDRRQCQFVTRLKKHSPSYVIEEFAVKGAPILHDREIRLNDRTAKSRKPNYTGRLREVVVRVEDKPEPMRIVTNDFISTAEEIALLYKKRWQIELFFKWIKQNLRIKSFLGTSLNAVKIQVITAMIAYLLVRITALALPTNPSMQTVVRLIQTSVMARKTLQELLYPPPTKSKKCLHINQLELFNA